MKWASAWLGRNEVCSVMGDVFEVWGERVHSRDLYTTNKQIRCFILSCTIERFPS